MSTLTRKVEMTPEAFNLLSRPVNGQGGYQDRLRRLQTAFNIEPDEEYARTTPSATRIPASYEAPAVVGLTAPAKAASVAPAATDTDPILSLIKAQIMGQINAASQSGDLEKIAALMSTLDRVIEKLAPATLATSTARDMLHTAADEIEEAAAVARKSTRKRRAPRLSVEERERRSKRMKALWRDTRKSGKGKLAARKRAK